MRDRILGRVRDALDGRPKVDHPGDLATTGIECAPPVHRFVERFRAAGGEVQRFPDREAAQRWLSEIAPAFESASHGTAVPQELSLALPEAPPEEASVGVSVARFAVAETGSLVMDSRGGRRTQLLPPTHLIWVSEASVVGTLGDALEACRADLPSALALHSGPSKSADIGQIMVTGVHGPGRVVAAIVGDR